jgi:hypothetical protein
MERGVYVARFGGFTEITAVDASGQIIKRISVVSRLMCRADILSAWEFLDWLSPLAPLALHRGEALGSRAGRARRSQRARGRRKRP